MDLYTLYGIKYLCYGTIKLDSKWLYDLSLNSIETLLI